MFKNLLRIEKCAKYRMREITHVSAINKKIAHTYSKQRMKRNLARRSGEIHSRRSCVLLCDKLYARSVIINIPNRYCFVVMWNGGSSWMLFDCKGPTLCCCRKYTRFTRRADILPKYKCKLFVICLVRVL